MSEKTEKIRVLNDTFRRTLVGGRVMVTSGVDALSPETKGEILRQIQTFTDFKESNDPHNEHDFGSIEVGGEKIFWKIDYYDKNYDYASEDPADPSKTARVLTIMLAEEY